MPPGSGRRRNAQAHVLTVSQVACEEVRDVDAAVTEPQSARSTVMMTGSARVTAPDRSESRMIGYHQGVAKAITGYWVNE